MEQKTKIYITTGVGGVGLSGVLLAMLMLGVFPTQDCIGEQCLVLEVTCDGEYYQTFNNFTGVFLRNYNQTYFNNDTLQEETLTTWYNESVYEEVQSLYCPLEHVESMNFTYNGISKIVDCDPREYTCSFKNSVLTKKSIARGGSWSDSDLDSCWNPGVPCKQVDFIPMPETTITEFRDAEVKVEI